jgi:hypothetical protein
MSAYISVNSQDKQEGYRLKMKKEEKKTKPLRRLLRSTTAKTNWGIIIVLLVGAAFLLGFIKVGNIDLSNLHLPFGVQGGGSTGGNVTRKIQFSFTDKYSGSALTSKTFYVYSTAGALLETLTTDSDGLKATARTYSSGDVLHVKYVNGNSKEWFNVVVPTMSANDAFSQSYNPIALTPFTVPATCTGALTASGEAHTTEYNFTANSTTPAFNWEVVNTGADNTGIQESYDYLLGQSWDVYVIVTISGTNYETVIMNGFDSTFTLGTTQYGIKHLNPDQLTKWKVGTSYQTGYQGDQVVSWGLDGTGYTGSSAHMYINTYAYCDPSYALTHGGQLGSNKLSLVSQLDITLKA